VLEPADDSRSFEIPQWMLDAAACCRIARSPTPAVTCEVLRELRRLIDSACSPEPEAMLQAGHLANSDPGGACAIRESAAFSQPAGAVSSTTIDPAVGGPAAVARERKCCRCSRGYSGATVAVFAAKRSVGRRAMSGKIRAQHLARKAVLYVRQSSSFQVAHNLESQKLQYAMQARLRDLGWTQIEVIDEDLGRSPAPRRAAASSAWSLR
jgi:hypothetical protein